MSPCWVWRMESGPRPHFPAQATEWAAPTSQLHPKATGPIFLKSQHSYLNTAHRTGEKSQKKLLFAGLCIVHAETSVGSEHPGEKWQGQLPLGGSMCGAREGLFPFLLLPLSFVFATNPMVLTYFGEKAYSWFCA